MKKLMMLVFLLVLFRLSASTIIVNSIFNGETDPAAAVAAGFVEDGLMESLFDKGAIMFSTFNAPGYSVEGAKDARYMISIEPHGADSYVSWKLNATVNGMLIDEGVVEFSSVPGNYDLEENRIYYLIGEEIAGKVSLFF